MQKKLIFMFLACALFYSSGYYYRDTSDYIARLRDLSPPAPKTTILTIKKIVYRNTDCRPGLNPIIAYVRQNSVLDNVSARRLVELTFKHSKRPLLLLALFQKESSFNPYATGKVGEIGLGQIRPNLHFKELRDQVNLPSKRDLYTMEWNIKATEHLVSKWLNESKGDIFKLTARYNGIKVDKKYAKSLITFYFKLKDAQNDKTNETQPGKMDAGKRRHPGL